MEDPRSLAERSGVRELGSKSNALVRQCTHFKETWRSACRPQRRLVSHYFYTVDKFCHVLQ